MVAALAALGYKAVDLDDGFCTASPTGERLWDEPAVTRLLHMEDADVLFLAGCEENQVAFYPRFDHNMLLCAPRAVIVTRVTGRTNNRFGQEPGELEDILDDLENVKRQLRRGVTAEARTDRPLGNVVADVLVRAGLR